MSNPNTSPSASLQPSPVGLTIDVYLESDNSFHSGTRTKYDAAHNRHTIKFDEGDTQHLMLVKKWEGASGNRYTDVETWWPHDKYYNGCITNKKTLKFHIEYNDGDNEDVKLQKKLRHTNGDGHQFWG